MTTNPHIRFVGIERSTQPSPQTSVVALYGIAQESVETLLTQPPGYVLLGPAPCPRL